MSSKVKIYIGMGTCALASGAQKVYDDINRVVKHFKIDAQVIPTGCIGACYNEVLVDIHQEGLPRISYGHVKPGDAYNLLNLFFNEKKYANQWIIGKLGDDDRPELSAIANINDQPFIKLQQKNVLRNCGYVNPESIEDYLDKDGYKGLSQALSMEPARVVEEVKKSGLRGRGGGGFPTGVKWGFALEKDAEQKYLICNADEGDPGAFMDRSLIEGDPFALLEGMVIAAYAIGASQGYVYVRAEYPLAVKRLEKTIKIAKDNGYLGRNILNSGFSFDLKIKKGAGAFVCGEETALIASIEGKRGMPKQRPPFPIEKGLFGFPTVINNVETLANVPNILRNGSEWFSSIGTAGSKGTKIFALTGKVKNSGLVEVPMGISLREIIFDIGGGMPGEKDFKVVQIGGPSGGCLSQKHLDIKIDYESLKDVGAMMGSGGLVVMDETSCMVDVAKYFLNFMASESCGKCTPCREGTTRLLEIFNRITKSSKGLSDEEKKYRIDNFLELENLAHVVKDCSLCALGQTAPNPALSTLQHFKDEYISHVYDEICPAGVCKDL